MKIAFLVFVVLVANCLSQASGLVVSVNGWAYITNVYSVEDLVICTFSGSGEEQRKMIAFNPSKKKVLWQVDTGYVDKCIGIGVQKWLKKKALT